LIEGENRMSRISASAVLPPSFAAALALALVFAGISTAPDAAAAGRAATGGRLAQSSVAGSGRAGAMSRPSGGSTHRPSAGNSGGRGNNANVGNNTNVGNNVNAGNNVNIGNDVNIDIDIDHDYGYGHGHWDDHYHPGLVIGAVAVTRAAVVGAYYASLPTGCTTVIRSGISYYYCGTVYYQQSWYGNDVVYVVVNP
jgi:hypothetical protein